MKKLGCFKKSLLMSAVALSVLSSSANAVSEKEVKEYIAQSSGLSNAIGDLVDAKTLKKLTALNDEQWDQFKKVVQEFIVPNMNFVSKAYVLGVFAALSPDALLHKDFILTAKSLMTEAPDNDDITFVMGTLGVVPKDKMDRVYGQIKRFQNETNRRFLFKGGTSLPQLIAHLCSSSSDSHAEDFMTSLIQLNKRAGGANIIKSGTNGDMLFVTGIKLAHSRASSASTVEAQSLIRRGLASQPRVDEERR